MLASLGVLSPTQTGLLPEVARPVFNIVSAESLQFVGLVSYASSQLGVLLHRNHMQRLTARFLLLLAIVGTFAPLALAVTSASSHACCLRMAHRCHDSVAVDSGEVAIRAPSCCGHDCCRAVTTPQWAHAQPRTTALLAQNADAFVADLSPSYSVAELSTSQSPRAPPTC